MSSREKSTRSDIMLIFFLLACICTVLSGLESGPPFKMQKIGPKLGDKIGTGACLEAEKGYSASNPNHVIDPPVNPLNKKSEVSTDNNALLTKDQNSWPDKQDQWQLFFDDAISLSGLEARLREEYAKEMWRYGNDRDKHEELRQTFRRMTIFKLIQRRVAHFQKFLELQGPIEASLDKQPEAHVSLGKQIEAPASLDTQHEAQSSSKKTEIPNGLYYLTDQNFLRDKLKAVFNEIHQQVGQVSSFRSYYGQHFEQLWFTYTLKSMDFFLKNNLFRQDWIETYLEDSEISNQVIMYVRAVLVRYNSRYFNSGSYSLAEHWFWALDHNLFKSANQDLKNRMNSYFLMHLRHFRDIWPTLRRIERGQHKVWDDFCGRLRKASYVFDWKDEPRFGSMNLVDEVDNMIAIVAWEDNRFFNRKEKDLRMIMHYICDLLELVETFHPKLINQKLITHPDANRFDTRRTLLHLDAKLEGFTRIEANFRKYIKATNGSPDYRPRKFRSIFGHHHKEYHLLLNNLKSEKDRVFKKISTRSKREFITSIKKIVKLNQKTEKKLRVKSARLLNKTPIH